MNIKTFIGLSLVCSLLVPAGVVVHSSAWAGCSAQERIELGRQGYDRETVEQACTDVGEEFLNRLGTEVANGLGKWLNRVLGVRESTNTSTAAAPAGASLCVTNAGTCPLSGGPVGYPCYCRAWNGLTLTGLSK